VKSYTTVEYSDLESYDTLVITISDITVKNIYNIEKAGVIYSKGYQLTISDSSFSEITGTETGDADVLYIESSADSSYSISGNTFKDITVNEYAFADNSICD